MTHEYRKMSNPKHPWEPATTDLNTRITGENSFPSLSEFHDYEPNLEFDDTWMQPAAVAGPLPELEGLDGEDEIMPRSASDGTIEENFERELASPPRYAQWALGFGPHQSECYTEIEGEETDSFSHLVSSGFIEVAGNDQGGRLVVIVSACLLPPTSVVVPETLLKYLIFTLDKFVEQDYLIVYLHFGLTSESRPPMTWFWDAYRALDRKFKKNLKALYLVHPTSMIKIMWQMFRPVLSVKFGKKIRYLNYLHELQQYLRIDQLVIPDAVREHDQQLLARNPKASAAAAAALADPTALAGPSSLAGPSGLALQPSPQSSRDQNYQPTQQFGVSLEFIREHNPDMQDNVPPIVRYCIDFLSRQESLATEGIFRRSTSQTTLVRMIAECNRGEVVNFDNDPHCAAVLLKAFLRELEDPILTHRLFDEILQFDTWPMPQRARMTKILLLEKLPLENYKLLKYIVQFLWRVADMSCLNKMTVPNLAVVFGPNFMWPPEKCLSLNCVIPINNFTEYILNNHEVLFII